MDKSTKDQPHQPSKTWHTVGTIFMSLLAGFFGAWILVSSDLAHQLGGSDSMTESRQRVISEGEVVADIAKQVSPSVVSIVTESAVAGNGFFDIPQTREGAGTGIIISSDGYILTNKHVIPVGTSQLNVVDNEGNVYDDVEMVGSDPLNDLAFLKINDVSDLQAATIGSSTDMNVGQKVVAIGNALGQFDTTVTSGIVSGVNRSVTATGGSGGLESLAGLLQTDAAINPGNSGGPLVNISGEVIGINTAVSENAEGIGFAIPIDDTKGLIKSVLDTGEVSRSYLGVRYLNITPEVVRQNDLEHETGAYITAGGRQAAIIKGSPADKAGLKEGDIITKVGDVMLTDRRLLASQLSQYAPGDKVELTVIRDGKQRSIDVTLEKLDS